VRVFYLVSSRSDFYLGTFSAGISHCSLDIYLLQKYAPGSSISIPYTLSGWTASQQAFTAVAQISGLRTTATIYTIILGSVSFNAANGQLIAQLNLNSTPPIESISITYIVFQNSAPFGFSSFNAMVGSSATYQFIGITQLNSSAGSSYAGSGFISQAATQGQLSCIGGNCPGLCITSQNCLAYSGQISGANCLLCGQGQIAANGGCQAYNPVTCGFNQYYNGTACTCYQGYLLVNSVCYQGCGTNAYIINSQCQCIPGYILSLITYTCVQQTVPTCGQNFVLINNVCTCKSGFGMINNLCLACPANSYVAANGNCVCNSGLTLSSNTLSCVAACYPNSYQNSVGQCICNSGYYNTGTSCILQPNCINGQIWNSGSNSCSCPQGMINDSITNQCSYCNTADRMVSAGICVCSPSYYPTSIGCSPCPTHSLYNITAAACICVTGYNMQNGVCVQNINCPLNSNWNAITLQCDCTYFQNYVINGYCQQCPLNSKWNGTACACLAGFVSTGTLCVCPYGQLWNGIACVCGTNKYFINNACTFCDANSVYNSTLQNCICKNGWFGNYAHCTKCDSSCATCSGASANNCLSCPSGTTLTSGSCLTSCNPNGQYIDANNICQNCMSNCVLCSSGSSCNTCASGYQTSLAISGNTVTMTCQLIPTGTSSTLTLRGQVTGNGVVYQGVGLSLMPTSILSNNCNICNSLLTVQVVSSFATITTTTEYVANSQYWFVISFNFGAIAFIPNFQFTVQLNPVYAASFSSTDMAQKLAGSYSQSSSSLSGSLRTISNPMQSTVYTSARPNSQQPPHPQTSANSTTVTPSNTTESNSTSITTDTQTLVSLFA
jgi:hypothetical protein